MSSMVELKEVDWVEAQLTVEVWREVTVEVVATRGCHEPNK